MPSVDSPALPAPLPHSSLASIFGLVGISCAVLFAWFGYRKYECGAYGYQLFMPRHRVMWAARLLCAALLLRSAAVVALLLTTSGV